MAVKITKPNTKDGILQAVGHLIDVAEYARNVEIVLKLDNKLVSTLSYKVDDCPFIFQKFESEDKE